MRILLFLIIGEPNKHDNVNDIDEGVTVLVGN